jgi:predicted nucleic acid-binding protein
VGELTLPDQGLVYLDSNAIIYSVEKIPELEPVTANILREAAGLRAKYKAKTPDSIHLATANFVQSKLCVTNDLDFRRVPDVPVAILSQL